jgi:hypothetical protein
MFVDSLIGLGCCIILIRIRIVALVTLIPVDITFSWVKPLEVILGPSSPAGGGDGIAPGTFITIIFVLPSAPWHSTTKCVIHAIVVSRTFSVSPSDCRLLKRHI